MRDTARSQFSDAANAAWDAVHEAVPARPRLTLQKTTGLGTERSASAGFDVVGRGTLRAVKCVSKRPGHYRGRWVQRERTSWHVERWSGSSWDYVPGTHSSTWRNARRWLAHQARYAVHRTELGLPERPFI